MRDEFAGIRISHEVLREMHGAGLTDDDIEDAALEAQLFNTRMDSDRRDALRRETRWFMERIRSGQPPTPEEMTHNAPALLRAVDELGSG